MNILYGPRSRHFSYMTLSGRCFLRRAREGRTNGCSSMATVEYVPLTLPSASVTTGRASPLACTAPGSGADISRSCPAIPLELVGNRYYEQRFRGGAQIAAPSSFSHGDIVVQLLHSVAPRSVRRRPMVDVTGVQTSFLSATERSTRCLLTLDEAVMSMHMHDGYEVPAVARGQLATGQLSVRVVYLPAAGDGITPAKLSAGQVRHALRPVEQAYTLLLGRREGLQYGSHEQGLQLAHLVAENCVLLASDKSLVLQPVLRDGKVVSLRVVSHPHRHTHVHPPIPTRK